MFQFHKFFIYVAVSGFIMSLWTYYSLYFGKKKDEIMEEISSASWDLGMSKDLIITIIFCGMLLLGWVFLPLEIIDFFKVEKKES